MKKIISLLFVICIFSSFKLITPSYQIALLKYNGGGDWYANLETSLPNLIKFCNDNLKTNINPEQGVVDVSSPEIFNFPLVHMTGHGNVVFNLQEAENLRKYLIGGGFLELSDNYGMDTIHVYAFCKLGRYGIFTITQHKYNAVCIYIWNGRIEFSNLLDKCFNCPANYNKKNNFVIVLFTYFNSNYCNYFWVTSF